MYIMFGIMCIIDYNIDKEGGTMRRISTTEFKNNFGKYVELGQYEEIEVVKRDKVIFRIIPERKKLVEEAKKFIGILPKGTTIGVDPDERG